MTSPDSRDRLRSLLVRRSLKLGDFTLASGARSSYYIDARLTTMSAEGQSLVGSACLDVIESAELDATHVGGLTLGADPITYAIAHESWDRKRPLDGFTVRKAAKKHGTARRIEGGLPESGAQVVVVEDTMTTGGSALEAIKVVEEHGAEVLALLVLVDRSEGGRQLVEEEGIPVLTVFTAEELLEEKRTSEA